MDKLAIIGLLLSDDATHPLDCTHQSSERLRVFWRCHSAHQLANILEERSALIIGYLPCHLPQSNSSVMERMGGNHHRVRRRKHSGRNNAV